MHYSKDKIAHYLPLKETLKNEIIKILIEHRENLLLDS